MYGTNTGPELVDALHQRLDQDEHLLTKYGLLDLHAERAYDRTPRIRRRYTRRSGRQAARRRILNIYRRIHLRYKRIGKVRNGVPVPWTPTAWITGKSRPIADRRELHDVGTLILELAFLSSSQPHPEVWHLNGDDQHRASPLTSGNNLFPLRNGDNQHGDLPHWSSNRRPVVEDQDHQPGLVGQLPQLD